MASLVQPLELSRRGFLRSTRITTKANTTKQQDNHAGIRSLRSVAAQTKTDMSHGSATLSRRVRPSPSQTSVLRSRASEPVEKEVEPSCNGVPFFKAASILSTQELTTPDEFRCASILMTVALVLEIPFPASASDMTTPRIDMATLATLSVVPSILSAAAAFFGSRLSAANLAKAQDEQFANRVMKVLSDLPLNAAQKRTFALAVLEAFGSELVKVHLKTAFLGLLDDTTVKKVIKSNLDDYFLPMFKALEEQGRADFKDVTAELQRVDGRLARIESQLSDVLKMLTK